MGNEKANDPLSPAKTSTPSLETRLNFDLDTCGVFKRKKEKSGVGRRGVGSFQICPGMVNMMPIYHLLYTTCFLTCRGSHVICLFIFPSCLSDCTFTQFDQSR